MNETIINIEPEPRSDAKIIDSWRQNAAPWTKAVRVGEIESRNLITNQAIVDAVISCSPQSVLDLGCGEGWLTRELATKGINVIGMDAVPKLIEEAKQAGGGDFRLVDNRFLMRDTCIISLIFKLLNQKPVQRLDLTVRK